MNVSTPQDRAAAKAHAWAFASVLADCAERCAGESGEVTPFHSVCAPPISLGEYMDRICTYAMCSPECYIIAAVLLDRLLANARGLKLTPLTAHRLAITAVLLAIKARDDGYYSNAYYAALGGVRTRELNALELLFLQLVRFRVYVSPDAYNAFACALVAHGPCEGAASDLFPVLNPPSPLSDPGASPEREAIDAAERGRARGECGEEAEVAYAAAHSLATVPFAVMAF